MAKRGVYFLANNKIIELVITFLNSFRLFNSNLSLCFIPYNNDCDQITPLSQKYNFNIVDDHDYLHYCDNISFRLHGRVYGHFRKLAAWNGSFDEFLIIDCDTVVLRSLQYPFSYLDQYDFITSTSHKKVGFQWVWQESIYDLGILTKDQIEFAANMGFIVSKKDMLPKHTISTKIPQAISLKPHMSTKVILEQPFLNYLIVTSGKRYTSLERLYDSGDTDIAFDVWAGEKGGKIKDGTISFPSRDAPISHIHWAGKWQTRTVDWYLYRLLRRCGLRKKGDYPKISVFMPYKKLWHYYRYVCLPQDTRT